MSNSDRSRVRQWSMMEENSARKRSGKAIFVYDVFYHFLGKAIFIYLIFLGKVIFIYYLLYFILYFCCC